MEKEYRRGKGGALLLQPRLRPCLREGLFGFAEANQRERMAGAGVRYTFGW